MTTNNTTSIPVFYKERFFQLPEEEPPARSNIGTALQSVWAFLPSLKRTILSGAAAIGTFTLMNQVTDNPYLKVLGTGISLFAAFVMRNMGNPPKNDDLHVRITDRRIEGSVPDMQYPHIPAKVPIDQLSSHLSVESAQALETEILGDYSAAMLTLEESIADALVNDPPLEQFLSEACSRIWAVIEAYAKVTNTSGDIELSVYRTLYDLYDKIEPKYRAYGGAIGSNPLALKQVLFSGNLRERMVLLLYAKKVLLSEICDNAHLLRTINEELLHKGYNWQLLENYSVNPDGAYCAVGPRFKKSRKAGDIARELRSYPVLSDVCLRIPMSPRELRTATKEMAYTQEHLSSTRINWPSGSLFITPLTAQDPEGRDASYLRAAYSVRAPLIASISGSSDQMCATFCFLGLNTKKDLYHARLLCIAWLVNDKSHSIAEVLTSTRSFDLPFTFSPNYYQFLLPPAMGAKNLVQKIKHQQTLRGKLLPDEYLSLSYLQSKLKERLG